MTLFKKNYIDIYIANSIPQFWIGRWEREKTLHTAIGEQFWNRIAC